MRGESVRPAALLTGLIVAGAVFSIPQAATAAELKVSGSVACRGGNAIVGVWVESTRGGSRWASMKRRSNASWIADYSARVTTSTPTSIRLHVGCGGTPSKWLSNNRSGYFSIKRSAHVSVICKEAKGTGTRCGSWGAEALIGMPFSGFWDRFGYAPPKTHDSSYCTSASGCHWATDLYEAAGTAVRLKAFVPSGVPLRLRVASVGKPCGGGVGSTVRVDVIRNGTRIGYVSYGHLKNVPSAVKAGANVRQDEVLGYLSSWPRSSCWQVTTASGVHTHFTTGSHGGGFSCYANRKPKTSVAAGRWIGSTGKTSATARRRACS